MENGMHIAGYKNSQRREKKHSAETCENQSIITFLSIGKLCRNCHIVVSLHGFVTNQNVDVTGS